ncbi:MAG: Ycf51 family protein [Vulcanococcus sp.]
MRADPLLFSAGTWLGIAGAALLLITVLAFLLRWGIRFRLVGVTSFTVLLSLSCLAFAVSYAPRELVEGAVSVPVVFDNGADLVIAAAPADLPEAAFRPSVEQVARNLRGSGRRSDGGVVHVRLRRVEPVGAGVDKPVILAAADRNLASGSVTMLP